MTRTPSTNPWSDSRAAIGHITQPAQILDAPAIPDRLPTNQLSVNTAPDRTTLLRKLNDAYYAFDQLALRFRGLNADYDGDRASWAEKEAEYSRTISTQETEIVKLQSELLDMHHELQTAQAAEDVEHQLREADRKTLVDEVVGYGPSAEDVATRALDAVRSLAALVDVMVMDVER